ncbi:uncharacterized protein [Lolium perenne]|uniref:uncharacterized protein n=1 Tax=Lolium perenne TaxID=4522 RepID=UPI0021EA0401
MSPQVLLIFAFYAWMFRSGKVPPPPSPPRRSGPASSEDRLRDLGIAGICREILRVVLARPPRFVGTVVTLALHVSALSLAHATLVARLADAWGSRWGAFLLLALLEAACLCVLIVLACSTAASFAISVASFYCCAHDDDRAREALVERLIEEARCRRLAENVFDALVIVLLYSGAAGAAMLALQWVWLVAAPGARALDFSHARDWFLAGLLYMGADYQLAAVVSVLEPDERARRCFSRSSALLAGNFCPAAGVFAFLVHCFESVHAVFGSLVLDGRMGLGFGFQVAATLAMVAALCAVLVAALVAHPVIYFVCKAYHNDAVDLGLGEHDPADNSNGVH